MLKQPKNIAFSEHKYLLTILVSLTWHNYGDKFNDNVYSLLGIPSELVKLIRRMNEIFFIIRLHPVQNRQNFSRVINELERVFANCSNVNFRDYNDCYVGAALSSCGGHITVASATSIEAWQLGLKTLLVEGYSPLDFQSVNDYFGDYIAENVMTQISRSSLLTISQQELYILFNSNNKNLANNQSLENLNENFRKVIFEQLH